MTTLYKQIKGFNEKKTEMDKKDARKRGGKAPAPARSGPPPPVTCYNPSQEDQNPYELDDDLEDDPDEWDDEEQEMYDNANEFQPPKIESRMAPPVPPALGARSIPPVPPSGHGPPRYAAVALKNNRGPVPVPPSSEPEPQQIFAESQQQRKHPSFPHPLPSVSSAGKQTKVQPPQPPEQDIYEETTDQIENQSQNSLPPRRRAPVPAPPSTPPEDIYEPEPSTLPARMGRTIPEPPKEPSDRPTHKETQFFQPTPEVPSLSRGKRPSAPAPLPPTADEVEEHYEETTDLPTTVVAVLPPPRTARRVPLPPDQAPDKPSDQPPKTALTSPPSRGAVRPAAPLPPPASADVFYETPDEQVKNPPSLNIPRDRVNGRPPIKTPSEDSDDPDQLYEPTEFPLQSEDAQTPETPTRRDLSPVSNKANLLAQLGSKGVGFGLRSIAVRNQLEGLKKVIPNASKGDQETMKTEPMEADNFGDIRSRFQAAMTASKPPTPTDDTKRFAVAPTPKIQSKSSQNETKAPGGPETATQSTEGAPPGAPPELNIVTISPAPRSLIPDPSDITTQPWYFAGSDRSDATRILTKAKEEGSYLVRNSERSGQSYTLCIFFRKEVTNIPIRKRPDGKFALGTEKPDEHVFETVNDLVRFHRNNAIEITKAGVIGKVKLEKIAEN